MNFEETETFHPFKHITIHSNIYDTFFMKKKNNISTDNYLFNYLEVVLRAYEKMEKYSFKEIY